MFGIVFVWLNSAFVLYYRSYLSTELKTWSVSVLRFGSSRCSRRSSAMVLKMLDMIFLIGLSSNIFVSASPPPSTPRRYRFQAIGAANCMEVNYFCCFLRVAQCVLGDWYWGGVEGGWGLDDGYWDGV